MINSIPSMVGWTGRAIREDKHGAIDTNLTSTLQRINITPAEWRTLTT